MTDAVRATWRNTTHDWAAEVDHAHLAAVRRAPETYAPGGVRHLILEVLAYAADEAECTGATTRTPHPRRVPTAGANTGCAASLPWVHGTTITGRPAAQPSAAPVRSYTAKSVTGR
ncbi:hypothetical protein ABZ798_21610 [Streptomyces sp. NPDC047803]|uniref:hypothetical protein n=1 Tax=Streptomyces sp. NPDC047803 TaxID=3160976 RepID=UPI0033F6C905